MRLYLIRHGDPDYARDTITPEGEVEAAALATRMAAEGLTRLYASPMGRAQATAAPTAEATGLPLTTLDWTAEWGHLRCDTPQHGPRCLWDIDGAELQALPLGPDRLAWRHAAPLEGTALGETYDRMVTASDAFLAELGYRREDRRYRVEAANHERVAVVCHGGFGLSWLAHLLGIPLPLVWSGFWLPPTSVSIILMDERSEDWAVPRMLCVGDTSHLHAVGRSPLPRGVKANYH